MRRRLVIGLLAFVAATSAVLVLPVYASPGPEAEPVETTTEHVVLGSVDDPAPAADIQQGPTAPVDGVDGASPTLTVRKVDVDEFRLVGVTWAADPAVTDTVVTLRSRSLAGEWSPWTQVGVEDAGQDADTDSGVALRGGSAPVWTGSSDGVEVQLVTRSGAAPTDVRLDLVDPGSSPADAALTTPDITDSANAASSMPPVYSRAQWGADERLRTWKPQYAPTISAATVHHTATSNDYSMDDVPAIIRSIYSYHAVSRGWGDIGYNLLVDRFGRVWEGRAGGVNSTVIAAHAGGFNTGTVGVSMIGDYDVVAPSQATVDAVVAVIAWKFSLYGVNPRATVTLTSGGSTSKYPAGMRVTLPTIFGHRDVGDTTCPGRYGYDRLGAIRGGVSSALGTGETIASRYASDPGLQAALGNPVGPQEEAAGVLWQPYERGHLYDSLFGGVHALGGANLAKFWAAGGPTVLGAPTTDELTTPDGVGRLNHFTSGTSVYWTPSTGSWLVGGAIRDLWAALGWETGTLGYPVSDEGTAADGSRVSRFQRGVIHWTPQGGARVIAGGLYDKWAALGGLGWGRGLPLHNDAPTPDGTGWFNEFPGGYTAIYWSPSTGSHVVEGSIRALWTSLGAERGNLGYPTADEATAADGSRVSTFQGGAIYWTPQGGARAIAGGLGQKWTALGGLTWGRGLPLHTDSLASDGVGWFNEFPGGGAAIYWSPWTGSHVVEGGIRALWGSLGAERGTLGYPTADEATAADGSRVSTFQRGVIHWTPEGGARAIAGGLYDKWAALGGLGWGRGLPLHSDTPTPDRVGWFTEFPGGAAAIYWSPSTGSHVVEGGIRAVWGSLGAERGSLGYPTSDEYAVPDGRRSDFQFGSVTWTATTGEFTVTSR